MNLNFGYEFLFHKEGNLTTVASLEHFFEFLSIIIARLGKVYSVYMSRDSCVQYNYDS